MGIILTNESGDETKIRLGGSMVIGKVEFLPMTAVENTDPSIRQISRIALEKYRNGTEKKIRNLPISAPAVKTVALCEICANASRLGYSTMCADCFKRTSVDLGADPVNREITVREFLMMCVFAGLIIFCIVYFAPPKSWRTDQSARLPPVAAKFGESSTRK